MTTRPPPLFYFNTITFNSGYYTIIDEAPLTESKADARYLIKTQTDTTNQLQTFSGGITFSGIINGPSIVSSLIKTENVQSTSTSIPLLIGNNQLGVNGRIDIGCNTGRNGNINIGTTQTTGTGNIVIGSDALTLGGTQNITINRPLYIAYPAFNNLTQMGGYANVSHPLTPVANNTVTSPISITDVPPGVYMANYNVGYSNEIAITSLTKQEYALTSVPASLTLTNIISSIHEMFVDDESLAIGESIVYVKRHCNSGVIVLTTTTDVNFTYFISKSGGTLRIGIFLRLTRIG